MPIDTNMYVDIIKRLSPEQAKKLSEKMDSMEKRRFHSSISILSIPIILLLVLTVIRMVTHR